MWKPSRALVLLGAVFSLGSMADRSNAAPALIPQPESLRDLPNAAPFTLTAATVIRPDGSPEAAAVAAYLAEALAPATGFKLTIGQTAGAGAIRLQKIAPQPALGAEGYQMQVMADGVTIQAPSAAGLFYGAQTLRQLFPTEIYTKTPQAGVTWVAPAVIIRDRPRFAWRGLMMDCCRHFMPMDGIKAFLDQMAIHKLNVLHWHLTDDQGWRIEIKKYPKLTTIGSQRKESPKEGNRNVGDGTPYGGFYTQDQVREIVAYATARHITVVPEIEMPGHAGGALAGYPELSCTGGPFEVATRWGVMDDVFCAGNEQVFAFLQDVLKEILPLFPSKFVHVGGDECPKTRWQRCPKCQARIHKEGLKNEHELQSYFIRRMDKFLASQGRRLIGWDEILEGGLAPGATVMVWRGMEHGIAAAKAGHDVVMTPTSHCYLDYYQSKDPGEPEAIGGHVPLSLVYSFEPVPADLPPAFQKHVLGLQGNLWSEYIATPSKLEYMAWPRGCAIAEIGWTPAKNKDYANFLARLRVHETRLKAIGSNYRPLGNDPLPVASWKSGQIGGTWTSQTWDVSSAISGPGEYAVTFEFRGGEHRLDIENVELISAGKVLAGDAHSGRAGGQHVDNVYRLRVEALPPKTPVQLRARVRCDGGSDSNGDILVRKS